jgi:hypothetical protein
VQVDVVSMCVNRKYTYITLGETSTLPRTRSSPCRLPFTENNDRSRGLRLATESQAPTLYHQCRHWSGRRQPTNRGGCCVCNTVCRLMQVIFESRSRHPANDWYCFNDITLEENMHIGKTMGAPGCTYSRRSGVDAQCAIHVTHITLSARTHAHPKPDAPGVPITDCIYIHTHVLQLTPPHFRLAAACFNTVHWGLAKSA